VNSGGFCAAGFTPLGDLFLGKDFLGKMDEVRIYNVPFSPADATALYNYGIMGCCQTNPPPCNIDDITWCSSMAAPFTYTFNVVTTPAGASVVWDFGDGSGSFPSTGGVAMTHTYPGPGTYIVCVEQLDNSGLVCDKKCIELCIPFPIQNKSTNITPSVGKNDMIGDPYPNPTNDVLYIPLQLADKKDEDISIRILAVDGTVVFEGKKHIKAGEQKTSVSLPDIAAGSYILEVISDKNKATRLFTKQ
jgi:hypothetical protein